MSNENPGLVVWEDRETRVVLTMAGVGEAVLVL